MSDGLFLPLDFLIVFLAQLVYRSTLHPVFHGVCRLFQDLGNRFPIRSLKSMQDMGNYSFLDTQGMADAHFDARIVFTSQRLLNGLKPIMATGCSLFTDPERPYGKVHIVLDD